MKSRRHHNNKGQRQIKTGNTYYQVKAMARRLKVESMNTKEIMSEFKSGDTSYLDAILELGHRGMNSKDAEALVSEWQHELVATPKQPRLMNEWGNQFFGRAETDGNIYWYMDGNKRIALLPMDYTVSSKQCGGE